MEATRELQAGDLPLSSACNSCVAWSNNRPTVFGNSDVGIGALAALQGAGTEGRGPVTDQVHYAGIERRRSPELLDPFRVAMTDSRDEIKL